MSKLLNRLFGRKTPPVPAPQQDSDTWIKGQIAQWQGQWHDLFDGDATLRALGEFDRPDPVPQDYACDFRLIFGLFQAEPATRAACLNLLPEGAEMTARLNDYLTLPPTPLPEDAARQQYADLVRLIQAVGPNEGVNFTDVTIIDSDTNDGLAQLRGTDDITVLLEGTAMDPFRDRSPLPTAARILLSEPLYATAGNYYHLRDWVTSAMDSAEAQAIQSALFTLWRGGWQVALTDTGVILAKRQVRPRP